MACGSASEEWVQGYEAVPLPGAGRLSPRHGPRSSCSFYPFPDPAGAPRDSVRHSRNADAQRGSARCSPLRLASHSQITISRAVSVSHMCRLRLTARKGLMPRSCSIDCFRDLLRAACSPPGHPSRRGRTRPKACDQPNRTHQHNDARSQATAA